MPLEHTQHKPTWHLMCAFPSSDTVMVSYIHHHPLPQPLANLLPCPCVTLVATSHRQNPVTTGRVSLSILPSSFVRDVEYAKFSLRPNVLL